MNSTLSEDEALKIVEKYCNTYLQMHQKSYHELKKIEFLQYGECNSGYYEPVWRVEYDIPNMDDVWFAVILSDNKKDVLYCSDMWHQIYYPHIRLEKKKLTPRERRLSKNNLHKRSK